MAFATGSGTYVALMAAVLAFATADGWTTSGGAWPISKGVVRGVDWNTFTATENDHSGSLGAAVTVRYLRIAVGTSMANATANALSSADSAVMANAHYTFTKWWIFSDSGLGKPNYISVVAQFSNGTNADCFTHFSFGEIDKHGMTHTGTAYATASTNRGYVYDIATSALTAADYHAGPYSRIPHIYNGIAGTTVTGGFNQTNTVIIVDGTINPIPVAGAFPLADTVIGPGLIMDTIKPNDGNITSVNSFAGRPTGASAAPFQLNTWMWFCSPQAFTGAVSMSPLPLLLLNNTSASGQIVMLGSFPNVRVASMQNYLPEDEISYASEDWLIFPMLRNTANSLLQVNNVVTSGRVAFVHKKVP